jgi:ribokinase
MVHRIAVVGSVNMDLVVRTSRMPLLGETLTGSDFHTIAGGKGANQAVAAARLGADVSLIGCIGNDRFGAEMRAALAAEGIELTQLCTCENAATGVAVIMVDAASQNSIVLAPGANALLAPRHIDQAVGAIEHAELLICQLETPLAAVERAVEIAQAHGTPVVLNPAPAQALPAELLAQVDYLIPNETEAALLTGVEIRNIDSAEIAAGELCRLGAKTVLITLGAQGVLIADAAGMRLFAAPTVKAVDTTAAGDTFVGAFAVGLAEGLAVADAIRFGQRAAAISVTRFGAQTSIPYRQELDRF